jgi:pyruvate-formate lyase-activating enzyme/TusA-related sulfurtransferase
MQEVAATTIDAGAGGFGDGVLPALIAAMRRSTPGDLIRVTGTNPGLGGDLELWCRFTRNAVVSATEANGRATWTIRCGELPQGFGADRPVGSRLWLYTNFDCNLGCDYCCVRSSPRATRRALGLDRVRRIAEEASALRVGEIFITGGEPFLLPDIAPLITACAAAAPTTVLTNGMLFAGRRLQALRSVSLLGVTLQISLDSPAPELHDAHRGDGTWLRAWTGVQIARSEGFRVRIAATVSSDEEAAAFAAFLDEHEVAAVDRVIRRIALRGVAETGVPLARADLVPEITITAEGVYWHPVGADDSDFFVIAKIFPLAEAFAAVRRAFSEERKHSTRLAQIFNCA